MWPFRRTPAGSAPPAPKRARHAVGVRGSLATPQGKTSTSGSLSRSRASPLSCKPLATTQGHRSGRPASTAAAAKSGHCRGAAREAGGWKARRGSTAASAIVKVAAMTFGVSPCFGQEEPNQQRGEDFWMLFMVMMTTMLALLLIGCWLGRATHRGRTKRRRWSPPRRACLAQVAARRPGALPRQP